MEEIKITELPLKLSSNDDDLLIINDGVSTFSIRKSVLFANFSKKTETGNVIEFSFDDKEYKLKAILKDIYGNVLSQTDEIDLPLEQVVITASYDEKTQSLVLTLVNGNKVSIPLTDLINGLVAKSVYDQFVINLNTELINMNSEINSNQELANSNKNRIDNVETTINNIQTKQLEDEAAIDHNMRNIDKKQNKLHAGANISIDENDVISVIEGQPVADFFDVNNKGQLCLIYESED